MYLEYVSRIYSAYTEYRIQAVYTEPKPYTECISRLWPPVLARPAHPSAVCALDCVCYNVTRQNVPHGVALVSTTRPQALTCLRHFVTNATFNVFLKQLTSVLGYRRDPRRERRRKHPRQSLCPLHADSAAMVLGERHLRSCSSRDPQRLHHRRCHWWA